MKNVNPYVIFCVLIIKIILILSTTTIVVQALDNGLVKTPPMGWLSWERFKCEINCHQHDDDHLGRKKPFVNCISESLFTQIADTIIERGYLKAGYDRIDIDDCWSKKSREFDTGTLLADPDRFPNGIKYLADYMHKRGLKLGIYQNYGQRTCMGYPGIMGHMEHDIQIFAEWQVDLIKMDACFTPPGQLDKAYLKLRKLAQQTNRSMVLSCSWPFYQLFTNKMHIAPKWDLISANCNLFRVFHDITSNWKIIQLIIDFMGDYQEIFRRVTGPGSWPDPDMLMIGNHGLNVAQAEAQMAIWCILPAPLFMSNDPRDIETRFEKILLNKEAISVNQDELALPAERLFHNITMDLWRRSLSKDRMAIVVVNRKHHSKLTVNIPLEQVLRKELLNRKRIQVLNIFTDETFEIEKETNFLQVKVKPTGVAFLKLTPI